MASYDVEKLFLNGRLVTKFDFARLAVFNEDSEWYLHVIGKASGLPPKLGTDIDVLKHRHAVTAELNSPDYAVAFGEASIISFEVATRHGSQDQNQDRTVEIRFKGNGPLTLKEAPPKEKEDETQKPHADLKSKPKPKLREPLGRYPMHKPLPYYKAFHVNLFEHNVPTLDAFECGQRIDSAGSAAYNAILENTTDAREALIVTFQLMRAIGMNTIQLLGRPDDPETGKPVTYRDANYIHNINEALGTTYSGDCRMIANKIRSYFSTAILQMPTLARAVPLLIAIAEVTIPALVHALKEDLMVKDSEKDSELTAKDSGND